MLPARWQATLAFCAVVVCASATVPARAESLASDLPPLPPRPPEALDDHDLYLHIGALGRDQSLCMEPVLARAPFSTLLPRLLDAGRYPALRSLLSSVRGPEVANTTPPEASMPALVDVVGKLNGLDHPYGKDQRSRLLHAKASFALWSELASVTEPACVPEGLAPALALVPSEP